MRAQAAVQRKAALEHALAAVEAADQQQQQAKQQMLAVDQQVGAPLARALHVFPELHTQQRPAERAN